MAARPKPPEPRESPEDPERPSFETRLAALEAVVHDLESADLTLEASLERYRDGVAHLAACRALLDEAEARLLELVGDEVPPRERPLRVGEGGLEPAAEGGIA
jgi:exodeoxyribonuclease VII small subunit